MNAPATGLGSLVSNAGAFGRGALLMSVIVHGGIAAAFVGWGEADTSAVAIVPVAVIAVPAAAFDEPVASADLATNDVASDAPAVLPTEERALQPSPPDASAEAAPIRATEPAPSVATLPTKLPAPVAIQPAATIVAAPPAKPAEPPATPVATPPAQPVAAVPAAAIPAETVSAATMPTETMPAETMPAATTLAAAEPAVPTQTASLATDDAGEIADSTTEPAFEPARFDVAALANPEPDYPWVSRQRGEQGRVVLRVEVTTAGAVARIEVAESSGHRRLDEAALETVTEWRFEPARIGSEPIATTVNVPITFRLEN